MSCDRNALGTCSWNCRAGIVGRGEGEGVFSRLANEAVVLIVCVDGLNEWTTGQSKTPFRS